MKYLYSVILLISFAFTLNKKAAPSYTITGTVNGLEDGTWLYLRLAKPDRDIDSCQVRAGHFQMKGLIHDKAILVYLHTARYTNYVAFWLENTPITIQVKAGEFKKGTITGSATEEERKRFDLLKKPLAIQMDSLEKVREATQDRETRKRLSVQLSGLKKLDAQTDRDYVRSHPNSLIAANLLSIYASSWGKDTASVLYNNMSANIKASGYGKDISEFISLNRDIKVGGQYVDFQQNNIGGKAIRLSDIKARYILVDFWASWCGPCREENPNLVKTYGRYKDKGFAVLGVSLDDNKQRWLKAVADDHLTWENVSDLRGDQNKAALIYGITGIPDNFLIDDKGTIIARNLRGQALDDKLKELLR
ncbi:AhpC/TSA family protein [Mucilaginibacter sp. RS28]|uniref:AhpC/TSA family protein n=1 Tax=Mucilaginibacter straminoryzae TaxID=2932774 RepID=A0A9X2B8M0_9SPHI|nr:AhpC/TSA family protein [Mucilaginibacter straminoryzae]MCJ8208845.1 AhpC/TSA family protein [Mucilaginibacter straminoryzae]